MIGMRRFLACSVVAALSFCIAGYFSYVILWHFAGLDNLGPDDAGAALGAWPVLIKATMVGASAAVCSVILITFILRRKSVSS
jgi:hypothetical protein